MALRVNEQALLKAAQVDMKQAMGGLVNFMIQKLDPFDGDPYIEGPDIPSEVFDEFSKEVNRLRDSIPEYSEDNVKFFLKEVRKVYNRFEKEFDEGGEVEWYSV